jgi:hypothetical protein
MTAASIPELTAPEPESARRAWVLTRRLEASSVGVLLLALCVALLHAVRSDGMTWDELPHTAAAYRYVAERDYRLNPEHPPIIKLVAGLPLLALDLVPTGEVPPGEYWDWTFINHDNLHAPIVRWARMPMTLFCIGLALLVWHIARTLYGSIAGLVALALVAFHPSLIAHGHLVTTDVAAAFTFLLYSWLFRGWCQAPSVARAAQVGLALGLAVCTRYTGWVLVFISLLLFVPWLLQRRRKRGAGGRGWRPALQHLAVLVAVSALLTPLVIWAAYGFRFEPFPGQSVWVPVDAGLGMPGHGLAWMEQHRVLPQAYLEGLRYVLDHSHYGHYTYLLGQTSLTGWWYYHPVAFLVKNTPGFLLLTAGLISSLVLALRRVVRAPAVLHWAVAAAVLLLMACTARLQLGERYALQVYPYLILLIAAAVPWLCERCWGRYVAIAGLAAHAVPSVAIASGNYLAYFNSIAGGPSNGHRWLADSNLDWGQDLPRLQAWTQAQGNPFLNIAYAGGDYLPRYSFRHRDISTWCDDAEPSEPVLQGLLAVNVNMLLDFLWETPGGSPYSYLLEQAPRGRAGSFFIYDLPPTSTSALCARARTPR